MDSSELQTLCFEAARLKRKIERVGVTTRDGDDALHRFHREVTPELVLKLLSNETLLHKFDRNLVELQDKYERIQERLYEVLRENDALRGARP